MRPARVFILMIAILLTACNLPFGSNEPESAPPQDDASPGSPQAPPSAASSPSGVTIFMPQQMQSGLEYSGIGNLTYFWLEPGTQSLAIDVGRSYADTTGFSLELYGETQGVQVMGGDVAFVAWEAATASGTPLELRGQPAYSYQSEGGVSLHWTENGNYYLIAGTGLGLNEVQALVDSLVATDLAGFQARLAQ